jgi:hypothetical protein
MLAVTGPPAAGNPNDSGCGSSPAHAGSTRSERSKGLILDPCQSRPVRVAYQGDFPAEYPSEENPAGTRAVQLHRGQP